MAGGTESAVSAGVRVFDNAGDGFDGLSTTTTLGTPPPDEPGGPEGPTPTVLDCSTTTSLPGGSDPDCTTTTTAGP
jgi:hypothetical protein